MAESMTPRLPETAEANTYAPYSFLAVFAMAVAVLFAVMLIVLGISAILAKQPLFELYLLVVPAIALLLAFAARRQVLNSEGTRVGLNLCTYAWWIAVVGGLGYAAYLLGVHVATRNDAKDAFQRWAGSLVKVNPVDPKNVDMGITFHGTLPLEKQPAYSPNDTAKLTTNFAPMLAGFKQSDLVRIVYRNAPDVTFEVSGLESWESDKNGVLKCKLTVLLRCPEGEFTMSLPMQKQTLKSKTEPTWQIVQPQEQGTLFLHGGKLTDYGERIRDLELSAQQLVYSYFLKTVNERGHPTRLFDVFGQPLPEPQKAINQLNAETLPRLAITGGGGWAAPWPADGFDSIAKKHFEPLDKGDPVEEEKQRKQFARCWRGGAMASPGQILQKNPDVSAILVPGEKVWLIRVPVEMHESMTDRSGSAARGVVVCALDDPAVLQELANLRKDPGPLHEGKPRIEALKPVPWRIVRIESDMKLLIPQRPGPDG